MCCGKRKIVVGIIGCFSILAGICGILMIVFSFVLTNSDFIQKIGEAKAFEDVEDSRKFIFYSLVIFSVFTIFIALCGCCFKCCKNRCFAIMYGTVLLPVWLFVIIVGGLAAGASVASGDTVEEQCANIASRLTVDLSESGTGLLDNIGKETSAATTVIVETAEEIALRLQEKLSTVQKANYAESIQTNAKSLGLFEEPTNYGNGSELVISFNIYEEIFLNQEMCSRNCPCKTNVKIGEWSTIKSDVRVKDYQRTQEFVFTDVPDVKTYDSYDQCIEKVEDGSLPENMKLGYTSTKAFHNFAKSFRESGEFQKTKDWIEFFEKEYECAGICEVALFTWISNVDTGKPQKSCVSSVKDDLTASFMGLGITTLISGILLFFIWLCQYCLWKK